MKPMNLDHVDRAILNILQTNGRETIKEIANQVFLSPPAVASRIERLEKNGIIIGYSAQINPLALGYHIKAFINIMVEPTDKKKFYPYIEACRNVIECNCVTGEYAMILEVMFKSTVELDVFIGELQKFGRTKTLIVFSTQVEHRGIIDESTE